MGIQMGAWDTYTSVSPIGIIAHENASQIEKLCLRVEDGGLRGPRGLKRYMGVQEGPRGPGIPTTLFCTVGNIARENASQNDKACLL